MLKAIEHAFAGAALLQESQHHGKHYLYFTIVATGLMSSPETLEQLDCASLVRKRRLSLDMTSLEVFKSGRDQYQNTLSQLITSRLRLVQNVFSNTPVESASFQKTDYEC